MKPKTEELYSLPTITIGKREYVEYWFANPDTGIHERFRISKDLRGNQIGRIKDAQLRKLALLEVQKDIENKLLSGWVPGKFKGKKVANKIPANTIITVLREVIEIKKVTISPTNFPTFVSHMGIFMDWLRAKQLHVLKPFQIETEHVYSFLNYLKVVRSVTNRTRNNYLDSLNAAFKEIRKIRTDCKNHNPCADIEDLKNNSSQHRLHKKEDLNLIMPWMREHDEQLYRFCRFFTYLGCRPIEATRVQLWQINLLNKIVEFPADQEKTGVRKVKRIFDFHLPDFDTNISSMPQDWYYFTATGKPGPQPTTRDYFTEHFSKVKKQFNLHPNQTMYSLRHTFMTAMTKKCKNLDEITDIMKITGHKSLSAFQHYIQTYLDEPVKDISHMVEDVFL